MDLINIEYISDDGETQEPKYILDSSLIFVRNQQRRYEMFSRALIK